MYDIFCSGTGAGFIWECFFSKKKKFSFSFAVFLNYLLLECRYTVKIQKRRIFVLYFLGPDPNNIFGLFYWIFWIRYNSFFLDPEQGSDCRFLVWRQKEDLFV